MHYEQQKRVTSGPACQCDPNVWPPGGSGHWIWQPPTRRGRKREDEGQRREGEEGGGGGKGPEEHAAAAVSVLTFRFSYLLFLVC